MDLVVELNGEKLEGKVWKVPIEVSIDCLPRLIVGTQIEVSEDGKVADVRSPLYGGWCKLSLPLNQVPYLKLRLTGGTYGVYKVCIYDHDFAAFAPGSGGREKGCYRWSTQSGLFEPQGPPSIAATAANTPGSICVAEFFWSNTGIAVHVNNTLVNTFTTDFDPTKQYYMFISSYYPGSKVELLSP